MLRQVSMTLPGQKVPFMGGVEDKKNIGTAGEGGRPGMLTFMCVYK